MEIGSPIRYNPAGDLESAMRFGNTFRSIKLSALNGLSKFMKMLRAKISREFLLRILVWTLVTLMVTAGAVYIQASRIPDNYHPAKLTREEAEKVAHKFAHDIVQKFGNNVKRAKEFDWTITQSTINGYLAATDEIAFCLPRGMKRGQVDAEMAKLGLADPAVAMEDGKLTLMIRSTDYNKILSAEISVNLLDDGRLKFTLEATRIGKLPVPSGFLIGKIEALSQKLTGEKSDNISETLAELLAAIGGEPINPPEAWRIQGIKVSIKSLTIANGELKMTVCPILPPRK
ncbi:MAG: hypothetical protein GY794_06680 [bacterium]|nr:hypothetical protein [bacterium]